MVILRLLCVIVSRNSFAGVVSHSLSMKIYQNSTKFWDKTLWLVKLHEKTLNIWREQPWYQSKLFQKKIWFEDHNLKLQLFCTWAEKNIFTCNSFVKDHKNNILNAFHLQNIAIILKMLSSRNLQFFCNWIEN